jgi:hypothetical protein
MTSGGRQRRDGSSKRVQLTSGDHGGPKDKKSKGARRSTTLGGKASRAARLREVERFRESIRAAEQRRTARQDSSTVAPAADTADTEPLTEDHPADADTALQVHLAACIQAAHNHNWGLLRDSALHLAKAADRLDAEARSGDGSRQDDAAR